MMLKLGGNLMAKEKIESQEKILNFVNDYVKENGYPPSIREICKGVGLSSTSTVHAHLANLTKRGLITKGGSKSRSIKVVNQELEVPDNEEVVQVPVVGKVAAGSPILATENLERYFPIPVDFVGNSKSFMLKVKGESMIEAGIFDGDYIIVKQQAVANNGDMVVALVGDEATVKTFYKEKDHIRLQPENHTMEPIIVKEVAILGKVAGVIRKL